MGNKKNKILSIISIVVLFSFIAVLYVVPSIAAINGVTDVASLSPNGETSPVVPGNTGVEENNNEIEPSQETSENDSYTLHVHRDLYVQSNHIIVDAYDGYGYIKVPSSLSEDDIIYGLTLVAEALDEDVADEITFAIDGSQVNLIYNQEHTESEINAILDVMQNAIGAIAVKVPSKPNLFVEEQVLIDPNQYLLESSLNVFDYDLPVIATFTSAAISYPEGIISDYDLSHGIEDFYRSLPYQPSNVFYKLSDNTINIEYPDGYPESDVVFALELIQDYLDYLSLPVEQEPIVDVSPAAGDTEETPVEVIIEEVPVEVEVEELPIESVIEETPIEIIKVPSVPTVYVVSQDLAEKDIYIHRELSLLSDPVSVDAYNEFALIAFPGYVTEDDIATGLVELYSISGNYLNDFDFAVENNKLEVMYSGYSESELNYFIDEIGKFLSSIEIPEETEEIIVDQIEKEPEIPVVMIPSKPNVSVSQLLAGEPTIKYIHRDIPLFDSMINVDAYDGYAIFNLPEIASEEEIAAVLVDLYRNFKDDAKDFDFAIENNKVEAIYSTGYTDSEVNYFLDGIQAFVSQLSFEEPVAEEPVAIRVPKAPTVYVSSRDFSPIHIEKEAILLGDIVNIDAYKDYAVFEFPSYVTEDEIAAALVDMIKSNYDLLFDFDFALDYSTFTATYSDKSEEEIERFLSVFIDEISAIKPVAKEVEFPFHIDFGSVSIDAYNGYAYINIYNMDQETVADIIVDLYKEFTIEMSDLDFALDKDRVEVVYPEEYTAQEVNSFITSASDYINTVL